MGLGGLGWAGQERFVSKAVKWKKGRRRGNIPINKNV